MLVTHLHPAGCRARVIAAGCAGFAASAGSACCAGGAGAVADGTVMHSCAWLVWHQSTNGNWIVTVKGSR